MADQVGCQHDPLTETYTATDLVLIPRGTCSYTKKVMGAQAAGAGAVIVFENENCQQIADGGNAVDGPFEDCVPRDPTDVMSGMGAEDATIPSFFSGDGAELMKLATIDLKCPGETTKAPATKAPATKAPATKAPATKKPKEVEKAEDAATPAAAVAAAKVALEAAKQAVEDAGCNDAAESAGEADAARQRRDAHAAADPCVALIAAVSAAELGLSAAEDVIGSTSAAATVAATLVAAIAVIGGAVF